MPSARRGFLIAICLIVLCAAILCNAAEKPTAIRAAAPTAARISTPLGQVTSASRIGTLTNARLAQFTALTEAAGKMYAAGSGKLAQIGENGAVVSEMDIPIRTAAGLSAFTPGKLIVGDKDRNVIFQVDIAGRRASPLFALADLSAAQGIIAAPVLRDGQLASLAFDGRHIYAALKAGYSSSIFKIDPAARRAVGHVWAPGPDPAAMQFTKGNLFVFDGENQELRRFDGSLRLSMDAVRIPVSGVKGLIIRDNEVRVLSSAERNITRAQFDAAKFVQRPIEIKVMQPVFIPIDLSVLLPPQKYALLITGDRAESGFDEFWNDTVWMYKTLRNAGYNAQNIYVLYGAGSDYPSPNPNYQMPGETKITDFPATTQWVNKVLDGMKNGDAALGIRKLRASDSLFVWTFDHGGGGPTNSYLCLMYGGYISDSDFAAKLNSLAYVNRAIYMQQCRSGGFIDNLRNSKTFISTACRGSENAHRADTENELVGGVRYHHGEYNYYVISALAGKTATGGACNADSNGNGKVSSLEAHNWMTSHENQSEIPQMDNMGGVGGNFYIK